MYGWMDEHILVTVRMPFSLGSCHIRNIFFLFFAEAICVNVDLRETLVVEYFV